MLKVSPRHDILMLELGALRAVYERNSLITYDASFMNASTDPLTQFSQRPLSSEMLAWICNDTLKLSMGETYCLGLNELTHWGWVTHLCIGKLPIIGSDNGLSPDRRQAIIWTNDGLLSIGPLGTYFSENLIKMQQFSLKKMHVKMSSAKWRPSCLCLNVLTHWGLNKMANTFQMIQL